jgi:hypothetical protein
MISGPLAFAPMMPGTGLVSIATAAQAILSRVLMREAEGTPVRINEMVIYSSFGWGSDDRNEVTGADIGRYVAYLLAKQGAGIRGETIHLRSKEPIPSAFAGVQVPGAPSPARRLARTADSPPMSARSSWPEPPSACIVADSETTASNCS